MPTEHQHLVTVLVYRDKGTPPKKGGGSSYTVTKLPHPLSLRDRDPYHFPTPLNT